MSKKEQLFSTEFKTKIAPEVLKGDKTINEIQKAQQYHAKEYSE